MHYLVVGAARLFMAPHMTAHTNWRTVYVLPSWKGSCLSHNTDRKQPVKQKGRSRAAFSKSLIVSDLIWLRGQDLHLRPLGDEGNFLLIQLQTAPQSSIKYQQRSAIFLFMFGSPSA